MDNLANALAEAKWLEAFERSRYRYNHPSFAHVTALIGFLEAGIAALVPPSPPVETVAELKAEAEEIAEIEAEAEEPEQIEAERKAEEVEEVEKPEGFTQAPRRSRR